VLIPEPEMVVYEDRFMVHAERAAEGSSEGNFFFLDQVWSSWGEFLFGKPEPQVVHDLVLRRVLDKGYVWALSAVPTVAFLEQPRFSGSPAA
jgi:hypothetical protein